jgi:hypothetical protein
MVITLLGKRPISWNQFYAGKDYHFRAKAAIDAHRTVQDALALMGEVAVFSGPVVIEIVSYMQSPLYDADNVCTKMYIDGLKHYRVSKVGHKFFKEEQKHWVIEDDNPTYVTAVASGVIKDKDNPRVEIHIKPYAA